MTKSEERPQQTEIIKEKLKNAFDFENTLASSGVYSTESAGLNKKINDCNQEILTYFSLERL